MLLTDRQRHTHTHTHTRTDTQSDCKKPLAGFNYMYNLLQSISPYIDYETHLNLMNLFHSIQLMKYYSGINIWFMCWGNRQIFLDIPPPPKKK